jgi:hypothetical protein
VLEREYDRPEAYEPWLAAARGRIAAALRAGGAA